MSLFGQDSVWTLERISVHILDCDTCASIAFRYVYKYVFKGPDTVMAKFCHCHICSSLVLLGLPVWSFGVDLVFFDISASMISGHALSRKLACLQQHQAATRVTITKIGIFDISASMIPGRAWSHQSAWLQATHQRWCHFGFLFFRILHGCKHDTWSRPVTPISLAPGHTPKMVPLWFSVLLCITWVQA